MGAGVRFATGVQWRHIRQVTSDGDLRRRVDIVFGVVFIIYRTFNFPLTYI